MNISSIQPSVTTISNVRAPCKDMGTHHFPREIAIRIRTLNLLAQKVVGEIAPSFCKIGELIDQPHSMISYQECEELFLQAFVEEFGHEQIDGFLGHFYRHFDPEGNFINYDEIKSAEAKAYLWKETIAYFCAQYVDFEIDYMPLETLYNVFKERFDPNEEIILISPSEYKIQLEQWFDRVVETIPDFSSDEFIQLKLLAISHAALLLTSLKKVEEQNNPNLEISKDLSVQDLFDELFFLLLDLPIDGVREKLTTIPCHEDLDALSSSALKKRFADELVLFLLDPQDPHYEQNSSSVYEVMSSLEWLDYEIKDFVEKLREMTPKKKSSLGQRQLTP